MDSGIVEGMIFTIRAGSITSRFTRIQYWLIISWYWPAYLPKFTIANKTEAVRTAERFYMESGCWRSGAIEILDEKKAADLNLVQIDKISSLALFCPASRYVWDACKGAHRRGSGVQLKNEQGAEPAHIEGYRSNSWFAGLRFAGYPCVYKGRPTPVLRP